MKRARAWLPEALVLSALLLLPLLFWWRLWALDPADRQVIPPGDFSSQYYPLQLFAARELVAGRLPAWNPYINAGQPGLADPQSGAFYPPNLLVTGILALTGLPFSPDVLQAQVILHFALASLFTYLLVRRLALRTGARVSAARFAGATAALSFTYAGYLTSFPAQQLTILETAVWLPLVLFFLDLSGDERPSLQRVPWSLILAGMALACALLAGHPQTAMYAAYASVVYGLFLVFGREHCPSDAGRPSGRIVACRSRIVHYASQIARFVFLPLLVSLALAAVQLVPTLGFVVRSTRAGLDYDSVAWGFSLAEFTHLLYPGYFGGSPQYVGVLPLILALAALLLRRARREVVFWLLFGLVAFLLAFGGNIFLYNLAYLLVPGFGLVRNQERVIYLFSLAVSVLAGYGALLLAQPLSRPVRLGFSRFARALAWAFVVLLGLTALWYFGFLLGLQQEAKINLFEGVLRHQALILLILGGSVLLCLLRLAGHVRRRWLMGGALALIWLNLFTVNWQFNLSEPLAGGLFPTTGLVAFLQEQPGTFRISSAGLLPGGANAGIVYELEDVTANTPLRLAAFQQMEDGLGSWRRWQLLNVRYVLSDRELDGPGLERVYEEGQVRAYRLTDPLPRAWLVNHAIAASDDQALELMDAPDWDPRATAMLPPTVQLPALSGGVMASAVRVVEAAPGRQVLHASSEADALLVVSQPFYPGWQARVDGVRVPIYRVDYLLQGVWVPAGGHQVELTYRLGLWPGILSLAAWAGCLVALILARFGRAAEGRPPVSPAAQHLMPM